MEPRSPTLQADSLPAEPPERTPHMQDMAGIKPFNLSFGLTRAELAECLMDRRWESK